MVAQTRVRGPAQNPREDRRLRQSWTSDADLWAKHGDTGNYVVLVRKVAKVEKTIRLAATHELVDGSWPGTHRHMQESIRLDSGQQEKRLKLFRQPVATGVDCINAAVAFVGIKRAADNALKDFPRSLYRIRSTSGDSRLSVVDHGVALRRLACAQSSIVTVRLLPSGRTDVLMAAIFCLGQNRVS